MEVRAFAPALLIVCCGATQADSWVAPSPMAAVSANAEWLVRLKRGNSIGETYGFAGATVGNHAEAVLYRYDSTLDGYTERTRFNTNNPVAPVEIHLTNDGSLITLDNWHNFGIGTVVAVYDIGGNGTVALSLSDIFTPQQMDNLDRSVSSIWWRSGDATLDDIADAVVILDSFGRNVSINYLTGTVQVDDELSGCVDDDT